MRTTPPGTMPPRSGGVTVGRVKAWHFPLFYQCFKTTFEQPFPHLLQVNLAGAARIYA